MPKAFPWVLTVAAVTLLVLGFVKNAFTSTAPGLFNPLLFGLSIGEILLTGLGIWAGVWVAEMFKVRE